MGASVDVTTLARKVQNFRAGSSAVFVYGHHPALQFLLGPEVRASGLLWRSVVLTSVNMRHFRVGWRVGRRTAPRYQPS